VRKENKVELGFVVAAAVVLNILGAVVAKLLVLNTDTLSLVIFLAVALLLVFGARVIFWTLVGRRFQLSYIYSVLSVNYLFSFVLGMVVFSEQFQINRLGGALIIAGGVLIVSRSQHSHEGTDS